MIKRFFYNPNNGQLNVFDVSHVEYYHGKKLSLKFDEYIRGIITDENKILLRVYYPYDDIQYLSFADILKRSTMLLNEHISDIIANLKAQGINVNEIVFNVTNEDAKEILNENYV